jgi:hypothetical protein
VEGPLVDLTMMVAGGGEEEPRRRICEGMGGAEGPAADLAMAAVGGIVEEKGRQTRPHRWWKRREVRRALRADAEEERSQ